MTIYMNIENFNDDTPVKQYSRPFTSSEPYTDPYISSSASLPISSVSPSVSSSSTSNLSLPSRSSKTVNNCIQKITEQCILPLKKKKLNKIINQDFNFLKFNNREIKTKIYLIVSLIILIVLIGVTYVYFLK